MQLVGEVAGAHGAAHGDARGQIRDARPVGDLRNDPVGQHLDAGVPVTVDVAAPDRGIGGDRHEHEQVLVAFWRDIRIDTTGLADVERSGLGHRRRRAEDGVEAALPLAGEEQRVVLQLRQLALDTQVQQQRAGTGGLGVPVLLRVGLLLRLEQLGLAVVQVGGRDHDVGVGELDLPMLVEVLDAGRLAVLHDDARDLGAGDDRRALGTSEVGDRLDHAGEPADRVQHSVGQVEVAHEVVHARGQVRRRAEEHRRVPEHLAQTLVPELAPHKARQRLDQQPQELRGLREHIPAKQGADVREGRVQKTQLREFVRFPRGVQVLLKPIAGAGLDGLEQLEVVLEFG